MVIQVNKLKNHDNQENQPPISPRVTGKMKKYGITSSSAAKLKHPLIDESAFWTPSWLKSFLDNIENDYNQGNTLRANIKQYSYLATNLLIVAVSIAILHKLNPINSEESCIDMCNKGNGLFDCSCLIKY
jgi:hypothetical protein